MGLYLIGLGIGERPSLTEDVYKLLRDRVDEILLEIYTSPLPYDSEYISSLIGKEVNTVTRNILEDRLDELLDRAEEVEIAILIYGDPLIATTHRNIVIRCIEREIPIKIFHNVSSYLYAITESGLDVYKFGGSATIIRGGLDINSRGINLLKENLERGLHTLFFLEYSYEEGYIMKPIEAINILLRDREIRKMVSEKDIYFIVMSSLGMRGEIKRAYRLEELEDITKLDITGPSILIVTGNLHFMEREYIEKILRRWKYE